MCNLHSVYYSRETEEGISGEEEKTTVEEKPDNENNQETPVVNEEKKEEEEDKVYHCLVFFNLKMDFWSDSGVLVYMQCITFKV